MPVLIWIHGGGLRSGTFAQGWFDGSVFADAHAMVVVTINYCIGPLGFLSLDADLAAEVLRRSGSPPLGTGCTNGMADQLAALNWTSTHSARFGGDPARITLAGESAGGQFVCSLAVSPLARPFAPARAVIQSGACTGPWRPSTRAEGADISAWY